MNQLLTIGQTVTGASSGVAFTAERFIGGGGQGEVYAVSVDGQPVALKWFFPHYLSQDPRQRERLEAATQLGAPSDRFLWPAEIATARGVPGFGYLMPLRPPRFKGMVDLVTRRIEPSFRTLTTAAFELAHSYLQLHSRGLCYRDISFGNVFFDPATGEVRICDNDNVDIDGQPGAIGGTPRFMAPELVRGEAAPSTQTDLFSLSVLLFYLLLNHHPLEGARESAIRCFDLPAMTRLYGTEPLFIFDPVDPSNRPVAGLHDNALAFWPIYPVALRNLFTRAYTTGILDPAQGRIRESEWRAAMVRLRDAILYCTACRAENFYDPDMLRTTAGGQIDAGVCWSCARVLQLPPRLRLSLGGSHSVVMLNHDTLLYAHHVDPNRPFDFVHPIAEVTRHPNHPQLWGLRNVGDAPWTTVVDGEVRPVPTGRSVSIVAGAQINFGAAEGQIRT